MTKKDKQIIDRAVKEEWRIGDRTRLKRLLEKNLKQYRENVELEIQNKLLGERCNQLLKDKGDLTDQIADIKATCDLAIEGRDVKIKELEEKNTELEKESNRLFLEGAKRVEELEQENAILEKALNLYVNWADECGIAWDNFPDMTDKWYKKVEEKNLGWIEGLTFMVKEEAKEQLVKECENGK